MRILYHQPYLQGVGADRWICRAWEEGFVRMGHEFAVLTHEHELGARLREIRPHLFMSQANVLDIADAGVRAELLSARRRGTRVMLQVAWPWPPSFPKEREPVLRSEDIADIYFGENEPEQMVTFTKETGKQYHVVPNAANPQMHYPGTLNPRFQYDVVYLGANLRKKRWFVDKVLPEVRKRWKLGLFGPGWTIRDNALRGLSRGLRGARLYRLAGRIDRGRIAISEEEERQLYRSAKVCLNFHEREDDGSQPHYIVNQRTFKIAACGGFQLCDEVPAIRKYFTEDEVVMARLDPADWIDKIGYYLSHEEERVAIQRKGAARAAADHLSTNRVRLVLELCGLLENRQLGHG